MSDEQAHWIYVYEKAGALWIHDGNAERPHALLSAGNHSDGFFNSGLIDENPSLLCQACDDLSVKLTAVGLTDFRNVDRVVGPAMGAITLAYQLADELNHSFGKDRITWSFVEKTGDPEIMRFNRRGIVSGEKILLVEDVLTTGSSVRKTAQAVLRAGGELLPYVVVLVNRSGFDWLSETFEGANEQLDAGFQIVSLISRQFNVWSPDQCPLCGQGSEAIKPKEANNWSRLTGQY